MKKTTKNPERAKSKYLFELNAELNSLSEEDIKKQGGIKPTLSNLGGTTGLAALIQKWGKLKKKPWLH